MSQWDDNNGPNGPGPGSLLLMMGLALGAAAAVLLTTKQGQQVRDQIAEHADDWKTQAAGALAEGREKLIASVEEQTASLSQPSGPVREKPK